MHANASAMLPARRAVRTALVLLAVDAVLIVADLLRHHGLLHDVRFAVTTDRGFGEWFQYTKTGTIFLLLLSARRRIAGASAWAALFAYLLVDDALMLHERVGVMLAAALALPQIQAIRPEQAGELLFYTATGAAFAGWLVPAVWRGDPGSRALSATLALPVALLVFFGAAMDVAHSLLRGHPYRYAVGLIEDGGEMIAMSVVVACVYWAARRDAATHVTLPSSPLRAPQGAFTRTSLPANRLPD